MHTPGEFGIVYKGYLAGQYIDEVVAIKTLKGINSYVWYQECNYNREGGLDLILYTWWCIDLDYNKYCILWQVQRHHAPVLCTKIQCTICPQCTITLRLWYMAVML